MDKKVLQIAFAAALVILAASETSAQTSTATLSGIVRDQQQAVVPGAEVMVTQVETGLKRKSSSSATGDYTITNLGLGTYTLTVSANGFRPSAFQGIRLDVGQQARVDVVLALGAVTDSVTISDVAPLLSTSSSATGQVVEGKSIESVALNGRQFWRLIALAPGVTFTPTGQAASSGGGSIRADYVNVQINGSGRIYNGWLLDGADVTEYERGGSMVQPNVDAIAEFKVESGNMSAEYGHTPNAISATIKSGTNALHGSLFEFLRNDRMDARNFFANTKNPLRQNQFGGTVGGPIRRNKVFFFSDMERTIIRQGIVFNSTVPSDAMRLGNFSEFLAGSKPRTLKDPFGTSGALFPGNIIPTSRITPQSTFFLKYMPTQSQANFNAPTAWNTNKGDIRTDAEITSMDRLMVRYSINDNREDDPIAYPALGKFDLGSRSQSLALSWTRVLNPNWLNEARFGYYRSIFLFGATLPGTDFLKLAGITGLEQSQIDPSFPQISLSGYTGFTGSGSDSRPKSNRIRTWQYTDNISYTGGKHDMKFGAQLYHQTHSFFNGQVQNGTWAFSTTYTGDGFGDYLLGTLDNVTRSYPLALYGNWANQWAVYWRDNYKVTPNLTLNVGVRWEYNPFFNPIRGQTSAFDYASGKLIVPMRDGQLLDSTAQPVTNVLYPLFKDRLLGTDKLGLPDSIRRAEKDWAPRFGFAWRPGGSNKFVVRSGYGLFYIFMDTDIAIAMAKVPPFITSQSVINSRPVPTRTWADFFQGNSMATANPNPSAPCASGLATLSCLAPTVFSAAANLNQTYMHQWNFSVQYQPKKDLSVEVGYLGNSTMHMGQISMPGNDPTPGPGDIQSRRPYPQWGRFQLGQMDGNANYNSMQSKIEKRYASGFQMLLSYTYSKCIDTGSNKGAPPAEALIGRLNRAVCDYNLPHVFVASSLYELPFGKGRTFLRDANRIVNGALGGWNVASVLTARSGLPFTPTVSGDPANTGAGSERPMRLGQGDVANPTPDRWFDVTAFAVPKQYTYGNSGRNILTADGLKQLDVTLAKQFPITESKRIDFRAEIFNVTNTPTFNSPSSTIDSATGGKVTSTLNAARILQFALKFYF
jgi:hypothetical protein